ncbi:MAG TPA: helix-turn-helix transcriptional regulator [Chitinophaga sp.]
MVNSSGFLHIKISDHVKRHGIHILNFSTVTPELPANVAHRDEHYQFLLQKKGKLRLMLDFNTIEMSGPSIFFILPGQFHYHISSDTYAFVLTVDPSFVQESYKTILDQYFLIHNPISITPNKLKKLSDCISFLTDEIRDAEANTCKQHIIRGLTDTILGMFTEEYSQPVTTSGIKETRPLTITRQFKTLLFQHFKKLKKPSDYAALQQLSTPYLNEAVKSFTGFTVSYWIQKMIITEAKRLLYHTDLTIKEIADDLGYDDHAYFSRLFTQIEKVSPVGYRKKYR